MKRFKYKYFTNMLTILALISLINFIFFQFESVILNIAEFLVIIALFLPEPKKKESKYLVYIL